MDIKQALLISSRTALFLASTTTLCFSFNSYAHAEHDKPRFVSPAGVDAGRCDNRKTPCKTIGYAAQKANKGDKILLSKGQYQINDIDTLFYLTSQLIPVIPGYDQNNAFRTHDIKLNTTHLVGVPVEYADRLAEKGFTVIVDTKGISQENAKVLQEKMKGIKALNNAQSNLACQQGKAGDFNCNNLDLLSHTPLSAFSTNPNAANDIWGFVDLNDAKEYAIIGLRNGVSVVDVSNPMQPNVIKTLPSQNTTWRDIKVYQYFDTSENRFKSYAYVTADNASVGLMILDLTQLPNNVSVASVDKTDLSAHNVYMSNVDYATGTALTNQTPYLHITGSNRLGGGFNSYSLSNPVSLKQTYAPASSNRSRYTHDASSMTITDTRKDTQCKNGGDTCEVLMDFNEQEFILWDKTLNTNPELLSSTTYDNAAYVHSGWWSEDQLYVLVHDELDESNHGLNTTVRIFDISDLTNPTLTSIWTGKTRAIDHNGFVRGNLYYMSNYERGITVLDISNPASPTEIGFFDTFTPSDNTSFNGAWGVYPFLPSGNILVSDINSGLYVLKDNTKQATGTSLVSLETQQATAAEGEVLNIRVKRSGNVTEVATIQYETHPLSANTDDYETTNGTLTWEANDTTPKTITIATTVDTQDEVLEKFMLRLFNPNNHTTLGETGMAIISITSEAAVDNSTFNFAQTSTQNLLETAAPIAITVGRSGNAVASHSIQISINDGASAIENQDFRITPENKMLQWNAGDNSPKSIQITPINDNDNEDTYEQFTLSITSSDTNKIGNNASLIIRIRDEDSNQAPQITLAPSQSVEASSNVTLSANVTDAENDSLTYQWTQTGGTNVTLNTPNDASTTFTAPANSTSLQFELTATDVLGKQQKATTSISVSSSNNSGGSSNTSGSTTSNSGGSSGGSIFWLLALVIGVYSRHRAQR